MTVAVWSLLLKTFMSWVKCLFSSSLNRKKERSNEGAFLLHVFSGMDLFEEALRRWEEALTFRSRQTNDDLCYASDKPGAGGGIAEQGMEVNTEEQFHCIKLSCNIFFQSG